MNKKVLLGLILVILLLVGMYLFSQQGPQNQITSPIISSSTPDCTGICASFDAKEYFEGEQSLGNNKSYTDPVTKNVVTFKLLTDKAHQAQNASFSVYVNDVLIGETVGNGISQTSFSPDHKYFAFRMRLTEGAGHLDTNISVADLNSRTLMFLLVNPGVESSSPFKEYDSILESYSWGVNQTILVTGFPVGTGKSGTYYRINNKKVWSFDLTNPQSTMNNGVLVNTLPE